MNKWVCLTVLSAALVVGVGAAVQRGAALRGHMPSQLLPWIVVWGASGYVVLCVASLTTRRPPAWVVLALALADLVLLLVQLASRDRDAQFNTLNFLPFWHLLIAVFAAIRVLSTSSIPSPGPSILGKPTWRVGLFLASFGLLLQLTPKPEWFRPLHSATSAVTLLLLGIGLAAFSIGGLLRLGRRASNNALQRTRYARR